MSPARARTRTARSGVECTNHEATAPPYKSHKTNETKRKIAADNVLNFEQKHSECKLSNQDRRYITRPKFMTIKLTFIHTLMKATFAVQRGILVVVS